MNKQGRIHMCVDKMFVMTMMTFWKVEQSKVEHFSSDTFSKLVYSTRVYSYALYIA